MDEELEGQGSEGQEVLSTNPVAGDAEGGDNGAGGGLNPAWNELLEVLPSSLHSLVTPHLSKWDRNYQDGINKVHSQYADYKTYADNKVAPDQINYALNLLDAIQTRPEEVLNSLKEYMGLTEEEAQQAEQGQVNENEIPSEFLNHPEFQRMNQMVETMAQLLVQQNQQASQAQEDQALESELKDLHEKHGDFDERWVLTQAMAQPDKSIEDLVQEWNSFRTGVLAEARQPGPKVLSASGGAPNNEMDPSKLTSDTDRKAYVAQLLAAAAQQSR